MSQTIQPFNISRVFNAPQKLLFEMWTDIKHLSEWMSPPGTKATYKKANITPGGITHYSMTGPDGSVSWGKAVYKEVQPYSKLVYINSFSDENENVVRAPFADAWPLEMLTTITFESISPTQTKLSVNWTCPVASDEEIQTFNKSHDGMSMGWGGTFDQLEKALIEIQALPH
jgi:uncharacterized protein YndB with AHSA1/START domain